MAAKLGGLAALLDRKVVTQCPQCDTDNPDLENRGYCAACGAVFRDKIRRRMRLVQVATLLGVLLTSGGVALVYFGHQRWLGFVSYVLGIVPLGFGAVAGHQVAGSLLAAISLRTTSDAQRTLRRTELIFAALVLYFLAAFAGCIPYYLYIERPRQQINAYHERFAAHLEEYLALADDKAKPDPDARPYLVGKAVAVEKTESGARVGEVHASLPPAIRAETPEEAGTVLLIVWTNAYYGPYGSSGAKGYRVNAELTMVNKADKTVLGKALFEGGEPPREQPSEGHGYGPKPIAKIVGYVAGLEKK